MNTAIIIIIIVAVLHFIYESIVLPTIHLYLKNRLFSLRDQLRYLKIEQQKGLSEDVFNYLHDSINVFLPRLHLLTISLLIKCSKSYNNNKSLRNEVIKKRKAIKECQNNEFKNIYKEIVEIHNLAFIANMGAWFFYIIPVALIAIVFSKISELLQNTFNMPKQAEKLLPCQA